MHKRTEPTAISSSADYHVTGVLSHRINEVWPAVAPIIERALEFGDGKYALTDIHRFLEEQACQLWIIHNTAGIAGALVTQIVNYPQDRRLCFFACAGVEADKWLHLNEVIKCYAREQGCSSVEIYGRPGWVKKMKPYGFKPIHVVLTAPL